MKTKLLALGAMFASLCASVQAQVLHLSFDQVSGTTPGSIVTNRGTGGSAMNGTVNVGVNGTLAFVPGKFGNALSVAGTAASDASVRITNAVVPLNVGAGQPPWTVAMWFQTTAVGGCFAYQGSGGWAGGNTMFYTTSGRSGGGTSGTHAGAVRNGQEWQEGTTDVNDGLWHHFVLTFNGTTKTMYLDGQMHPMGENNWSGNGTGNQIWIGGNPYNGDGSTSLNGLIDEVYVFNRALSATEVAALNANNALTPENPTSLSLVVNSNMFSGQTQSPTANAVFPTYGPLVVGASDFTNVTSSSSSIVRVEAGNVLRGIGSGTATITASMGGLTSVADITVTVPVLPTTLKHRYSFNEPTGSTTVSDSIGGAPFAGTVYPPTTNTTTPVVISNGMANFPGAGRATAGYIDLPDNMISSAFTNVTVEFWFTYNPATGNAWGRVFDFGNSSKGADPTVNAGGLGYLHFVPRNGGGNPQMEFRTEAPHTAVALAAGPAFPVGREVHVVCTFAPGVGYSVMYIDGSLRAAGGTPLYGDPPALYQLNQLVDGNMWLSASAYNDPQVDGRLNELRIHEGLMDEVTVALSRKAGPNALPINPGSLQSVSLNAPPLYINNPVATQAALLGTYQNVSDVDITTFLAVQLRSTDTNIFTVSATGLMSPVSLGTASLIANYQTFSATSSVSVLAPVSLSVTNLPGSMNLGAGTRTVPLFAEFAGGISNVNVTAFNGVTRSSSATGVATVTGAGVITSVSAGTSTITSTYSGQTNQAVVTVVAPSSVYVTNLPATRDAGSVNFTVNLFAAYPDGTTNVNVTTGVTGVLRSSSDTNVATITGAGVITVRNPGTTIITSAFGGQTNQATLTVTTPAGFARGTLIHRYSFSEAKDTTTVNDSVGGKHGEVRNLQGGSDTNNFTGTGQLSIGPGPTQVANVEPASAYVNLPNGLISGLSSVTIEGWFTWHGGAANQRIFDFGMSSGFPDGSGGTASTNYLEDAVNNPGRNYFFLLPAANPRFALDSDTGNTANAEAPNITSSIAITVSNLSHFAVVYDYPRGVARLYINGQRAGTGATPYPLSVVDDRNAWLGRSQWLDPMYNGTIDEFRIYNGVFLDNDITDSFAAGPSTLPVSRPTITITRSASNVVLTWPVADSAGFLLKASGVLGAGQNFTNVNTLILIVGGNNQATLPSQSGDLFFRLEK